LSTFGEWHVTAEQCQKLGLGFANAADNACRHWPGTGAQKQAVTGGLNRRADRPELG
jgi:hypothetical protein